MIGFYILRERLLEHLRHRIHNGETTERGMALRAGISQPHLHNLLKGVRMLNADTGDKLLQKLGMTVLDLFDSDELRRALFVRTRSSELSVEVPVLKARLGPALPWPDLIGLFERVQVPVRAVSGLRNAVIASLADDPAMAPVLVAGDLVLLDNTHPAPAAGPEVLFAVELNGCAAIRWIRRGRNSIYLASAATRERPLEWQRIENAAAIRARAIPLRSMHQPELLYDPLLPRDTRPAPAPRSVAN